MNSDDRKAILGSWKLVESYLGTQSVRDPDLGKVFRFTPKRLRKGGDEDEYELFPDQRPGQINTYFSGRDFVVRGIYELNGDTLRLRFQNTGLARPRSFDRAADSHHPTQVFKRLGKAAPRKAAATPKFHLAPMPDARKLLTLMKRRRQPREGTGGRDAGWYRVATLPLPSGKLWIGDPMVSWAELQRREGTIITLKPGAYEITAKVTAFGKSHFIATLRVCQGGVGEPELGGKIDETGTDSGAIGIADAKAAAGAFRARFGDDDDAPYAALTRFAFNGCALLQPNGPNDAGIVCVESGFGDGTGPVLELRCGRKRVGVELPFIEPGTVV